jgi:hypothetical protein
MRRCWRAGNVRQALVEKREKVFVRDEGASFLLAQCEECCRLSDAQLGGSCRLEGGPGWSGGCHTNRQGHLELAAHLPTNCLMISAKGTSLSTLALTERCPYETKIVGDWDGEADEVGAGPELGLGDCPDVTGLAVLVLATG